MLESLKVKYFLEGDLFIDVFSSFNVVLFDSEEGGVNARFDENFMFLLLCEWEGGEGVEDVGDLVEGEEDVEVDPSIFFGLDELD